MRFDEHSLKSRIELEVEEKLHQLMISGQINSAEALRDAREREMSIARAREARERESRIVAERQTRAAETGNQLSQRQVNLTENAIKLAERADRHSNEANRLSKWALGIGIASLIVSLITTLFK